MFVFLEEARHQKFCHQNHKSINQPTTTMMVSSFGPWWWWAMWGAMWSSWTPWWVWPILGYVEVWLQQWRRRLGVHHHVICDDTVLRTTYITHMIGGTVGGRHHFTILKTTNKFHTRTINFEETKSVQEHGIMILRPSKRYAWIVSGDSYDVWQVMTQTNARISNVEDGFSVFETDEPPPSDIPVEILVEVPFTPWYGIIAEWWWVLRTNLRIRF